MSCSFAPAALAAPARRGVRVTFPPPGHGDDSPQARRTIRSITSSGTILRKRPTSSAQVFNRSCRRCSAAASGAVRRTMFARFKAVTVSLRLAFCSRNGMYQTRPRNQAWSPRSATGCFPSPSCRPSPAWSAASGAPTPCCGCYCASRERGMFDGLFGAVQDGPSRPCGPRAARPHRQPPRPVLAAAR